MWKGLTMTPNAVKKMENLIQRDSEAKGIRLNIKKSGCAGFEYVMDLVKKKIKDDLTFTTAGVTLFVSPEVMPLIDGTEIDYQFEGLNECFKFNNPQAQNLCGCGESFSVE
ncbi:iron-sulfur cluster assembly accessory protein [Candidatus Ishikawella capsulata]|uniref:Iron-sulfur cluster assembly scaffold protein n=1 Tax=Candidatus Ishikawaella capsulata Mpkobe TaxID=476281 RepID=C5WD94_9ENTR|nr:iron-sulfur cluster assembly accessory protein [Candidatus Ishikawaella capsulata]BAH83300.1 iron-sulfur cluster assembly scaffold protein [Candidatus Ishikawaella capsulata Mpkobe]